MFVGRGGTLAEVGPGAAAALSVLGIRTQAVGAAGTPCLVTMSPVHVDPPSAGVPGVRTRTDIDKGAVERVLTDATHAEQLVAATRASVDTLTTSGVTAVPTVRRDGTLAQPRLAMHAPEAVTTLIPLAVVAT